MERKCQLVKSRRIYQEREATNELDWGVSHSESNDVVLNTSQMRDALAMSDFRLPIPILDREFIITVAAKLEIDERKKRKTKKDEIDAGKGTKAGTSQSASKTSSRVSTTSHLRRIVSQTSTTGGSEPMTAQAHQNQSPALISHSGHFVSFPGYGSYYSHIPQ